MEHPLYQIQKVMEKRLNDGRKRIRLNVPDEAMQLIRSFVPTKPHPLARAFKEAVTGEDDGGVALVFSSRKWRGACLVCRTPRAAMVQKVRYWDITTDGAVSIGCVMKHTVKCFTCPPVLVQYRQQPRQLLA